MHVIIEVYPVIGKLGMSWRIRRGNAERWQSGTAILPAVDEESEDYVILSEVSQQLWIDAERVKNAPF